MHGLCSIQTFWRPSNFLKALIKIWLKISPHKCHFVRSSYYMDFISMLKEGKPSYTPMTAKCNATIKMKVPKSVKDCRKFYKMEIFCHHFSKILESISYLYMKHRKIKISSNGWKNVKKLLITSRSYWLCDWFYAYW